MEKLGYLDLMTKLGSHIQSKAENQTGLLFDHPFSRHRVPSAQIEISNIFHDTNLIVICVVRVMLCNPIISVFQRERFTVGSLCKDTSN